MMKRSRPWGWSARSLECSSDFESGSVLVDFWVNRDRTTWIRMTQIAIYWLPTPRILHPWLSDCFSAKHPRWEPGAQIVPAGICAGVPRIRLFVTPVILYFLHQTGTGL